MGAPDCETLSKRLHADDVDRPGTVPSTQDGSKGADIRPEDGQLPQDRTETPPMGIRTVSTNGQTTSTFHSRFPFHHFADTKLPQRLVYFKPLGTLHCIGKPESDDGDSWVSALPSYYVKRCCVPRLGYGGFGDGVEGQPSPLLTLWRLVQQVRALVQLPVS